MFRTLRIAVLLLILVFVLLNSWLDRLYSRDWDGPLQVTLFPVNADGSEIAEQFVRQLESGDLRGLEDFFTDEARHYKLPLDRPLRFTLAPPLAEMPPLPPEEGGRLGIMLWSLKLRWFTWRTPDPPGPTPTIRMFVLYHDPQIAPMLPHSTGLEKGLVGIAHVFAAPSMVGANQVVIAHEVLHTLSASDKYDMATNLPLLPDGYADPERQPLYPQAQAELMAGRIPLSDTQAEQAESLRQVRVGLLTAREIGWVTTP